MAKDFKPRIVILSTGGTISGIVTNPRNANNKNALNYKIGKVSIESLLTPQMRALAELQIEQIANIDSIDLSDKILLKLTRRVNRLMRDSKNATHDLRDSANARDLKPQAIIITHGTDRMEESAFFVHLTANSTIPIIFTGAMRPQNAHDSDGVRNLYNAILFARSFVRNGVSAVFVAMNGSAFLAREVSKTHTLNLDAFNAPNGAIATITNGKVKMIRKIDSRVDSIIESPFESPQNTPLKIAKIKKLPKKLPKVSIIYATNDALPLIHCALKAKSKGIIIVGSGAGSIPKKLKSFLAKLIKKREIFIIKSTHINDGAVLLSAKEKSQGFISAHNLNPQKAKILLQVALLYTNDIAKITRIFTRY